MRRWSSICRKMKRLVLCFRFTHGLPPEIVLRFINRISLKEYQNQYLFFVCSCGDDTGLTQQSVGESVE